MVYPLVSSCHVGGEVGDAWCLAQSRDRREGDPQGRGGNPDSTSQCVAVGAHLPDEPEQQPNDRPSGRLGVPGVLRPLMLRKSALNLPGPPWSSMYFSMLPSLRRPRLHPPGLPCDMRF
jgi:hypothetical protein